MLLRSLRTFAICACAFVLAPGVALAQSAPVNVVGHLRVTDIMPALLGVLADGAGKTPAERVALLKARVLVPNRAAFENNEFTFDDVRLAWYLDDLAPLLPELKNVSAAADATMPQAAKAFETAFPDLPDTPVYFMPSFFNFDGQSRDGSLFIGVDALVQTPHNLNVLFDHELFHVYRFRANPNAFSVASGASVNHFFAQLWDEGLATYISARLNPKATETDVLLSPQLASLDTTARAQLACSVAPYLTRANENDVRSFFQAGLHPEGFPTRSGYLAGYLVAQDLGATRSLHDLAMLHGAALRDAVIAAVMMRCGR